jgi:hypothetical protein
MKKRHILLAAATFFTASPLLADSLSHCPQASAVKETVLSAHRRHLDGVTELNGERVSFVSYVYQFDVPVAYFKEARLERSTDGKTTYLKCVYVQKSGTPVALDPLYTGTGGYPVTRPTTGHADGPWSARECNSQDPADCLFYLK